MKPNDWIEQPTNEIEQEAAALASEMLAFMSEQFHEAGNGEKLELIQRYSPAIRHLQKAVRRGKRRARLSGFSALEMKDA